MITPDGEYCLSGSNDHRVNLWHLPTGKLRHTFTGHSQGVEEVTLTPNGQILISASDDQTIKLWSLKTQQFIITLTGHQDGPDIAKLTQTAK